MALEKSGVQLVAENESGFLGAMGRAQKAVQGFEGSVKTGTPALGGMNLMSLTLATALGSALYNGAVAAMQGFFNLAKSAFVVTAEYERMGVSLQTLLAREINSAGASQNMAEAFDMAAPAARELLNWIEQLAIQSPFDQAGVAAAYQTLQVYGFLSLGAKSVADAQAQGIVTAQRLTEALINQASVSTRGAESMGLVSYALGQIRTAGKLLMQDLRQLMNAGVDVNSILGEMGYSLADVGKEAISSDAFLLKFVETVERDLGGAAQRQAGTLAGLANSLADLGKKYLREFFGPFNEGTGKMGGILGVVQPILQKFVDILMDERVIKAVHDLGLMIGEGLTGSFTTLANILNGLIDTFAAPFQSAASSAFGWGANIIIQLAQGIINAAGSILISAINFVAQILSNWFSPGSPPAVAPEIDSWGQAAMGEFLHGFTEADFSVLKGIQQPLQAALQTMMQAGDIDAQQLADTYASITAGLAEALATGGDPSEIFAQIAEEAGAFGPELAHLAELQFELAGGVEAVKTAEESLANARKAEEDAGKAVMQLTQEYNDLLRGGADDATLQMKLEEINAAEAAKDLAGEQVDEAETQLDVAKANLDVMEAQVKLQQELVNQLIELARLQAAAIPPEEVVPPGTGGGGDTEPPGGGIDLPDPGEVVGNFIEDILAQIQAAAAAMFAPITEAWGEMVDGILEAWDEMWANLQTSGLLEQLQSIWDNALALTQIAISIIGEFISKGLETILRLWDKHKIQVGVIWEKMWNLVASIAGGVLGLIVSNIDERLQEARGFFETHRTQVSSIIDAFWGSLEGAWDTGLSIILDFVETRLDSMQMLWDTNGILILDAVDRLWDGVSAVFWDVFGVLLTFVEGSLQLIETWWDEHGKNVEIVVGRFLGIIGNIFDFALLYISSVVLFFTDFFADLWNEHGAQVTEIVQGFMDAISIVFETILNVIGAFFDGWAAIFTGDWEAFGEAISDFWSSIWDGITSYLSNSFATIGNMVGLFIDAVVLYFTNLYNFLIGHSLIPDMMSGISAAFDGMFAYVLAVFALWINTIKTNLELFKTWWGDLWGDIRQKIVEIWDGIVTKVEERVQIVYDNVTGKIQEIIDDINGKVGEFTSIGENMIQGLIDGALSKADAIVTAIKTMVADAIAAAMAALGEHSPSKVFAEIGANVSFGMAQGIDDEKRTPVKAISDMVNAMINPPLVTQAAGNTTNYNSMQVSFQNNVGNGIDVAALDQHIVNVIKSAFGGR